MWRFSSGKTQRNLHNLIIEADVRRRSLFLLQGKCGKPHPKILTQTPSTEKKPGENFFGFSRPFFFKQIRRSDPKTEHCISRLLLSLSDPDFTYPLFSHRENLQTRTSLFDRSDSLTLVVVWRKRNFDNNPARNCTAYFAAEWKKRARLWRLHWNTFVVYKSSIGYSGDVALFAHSAFRYHRGKQIRTRATYIFAFYTASNIGPLQSFDATL